jgi:hypothetical protein
MYSRSALSVVAVSPLLAFSQVPMKLATRKLDNLGYVKSYGGIQNDPERLHR